MIDLDEEIEIINFDIEQTAARIESLLRAPWEHRVCDRGAWHRALRSTLEQRLVLREIRKELFAEREDLLR